MSDPARNQTDKELARMEKYLASIFAEAEKKLISDAKRFLEKFNEEDSKMKSAVDSGDMDEDDYNDWRVDRLRRGDELHKIITKVKKEMANCNKTAIAYINGEVPDIFAINYNSIAEVIANSPVNGYTFELIDANTVRNIVTADDVFLPPPQKELDITKDMIWNAKQVNAQLLQGILLGESVDEIAGRMANVCNSNASAARRNARTMITAAENSGRQSGMNKAEKDGIVFKKKWIGFDDGRERDSHIALNGTEIPNGEMFHTINGDNLEFPGDWRANGYEVYNCRCSLGSVITGFKKKRLNEVIEEQEERQIEIEQQTEVKNPIDNANTIEEVEELLKKSGWFAPSEKINKLDGCDIESARMIYNAYEKIFNKYEFLRGKFLGVLSENAKESQYACASSKVVYVNRVNFSNFENLRQDYLDDVARGYHPKGTDIEAIMVHEVGHNIDFLLAKIFERASSYESSSMKKRVMKEFDKDISIKKEVSRYAEKNSAEWFAECFAEYMCSDNPRPVSKAFGEELEKTLEKAQKEYDKKIKK